MAFAPMELSMAIHYFVRADDFPGVVAGLGPQTGCVSRLLEAGLIEATPDGPAAFAATDGMRVYIDALLAVPYPVKKWVMPGDDEP